jgi:hypothetical protein
MKGMLSAAALASAALFVSATGSSAATFDCRQSASVLTAVKHKHAVGCELAGRVGDAGGQWENYPGWRWEGDPRWHWDGYPRWLWHG